jgi:hypothetical protein
MTTKDAEMEHIRKTMGQDLEDVLHKSWGPGGPFEPFGSGRH